MNIHSRFLTMTAAIVAFGTGCISFPMGEETYTAEFPSDIRPTARMLPKSYKVSTVVGEGDEFHRTATIELAGQITSGLPHVQHYKSVTVEKRKKLAFGLFPGTAEVFFNTPGEKRLWSIFGLRYWDSTTYQAIGGRADFAGFFFYTPVALLYEPFFGTWECHSHHWAGKNVQYLQKFSPEEREKIGAFTRADQDAHPQAWIRSGFTHSALIGFHRYCDYEVHDPVESTKTTPAPSKTVTTDRKVAGPYSVQLELPSIGFSQTVAVPLGQTMASFDLPSPPAGGLPFANGSVRFLPPPGGLEAVRNEDDRALLKQAIQREWPVAIALPASR